MEQYLNIIEATFALASDSIFQGSVLGIPQSDFLAFARSCYSLANGAPAIHFTVDINTGEIEK